MGLPACASTNIQLPLLVSLKPRLRALLAPGVFKCPRCSRFTGAIGGVQAPPHWWDPDLVPMPRVRHFTGEMDYQGEAQAYMDTCHYRECVNKVLKSEKLMRFGPSLSQGSIRDLTFQMTIKSYQKTF